MPDSAAARRYALPAAVIVGWWTLHGIAAASQYHLLRSAAGEAVTWRHALITALATAYLWIPFTVLALALTWRFPLERDRWRAAVPIHLAAALAVPPARVLAVAVLNPWVGWYPVLPGAGTMLLSTYVNNFVLYAMLVGVAHALHYARRYRQRERQAAALQAELARAQLSALRAQIQPHFLFNTLNTISSLVQPDPAAAERMIARLSDLLRHALDRTGRQEVELREELDFLESYLEIEQARFEDRLRVRWRIDPASLGARIPPLVLQPLVENAVRHGLAPRSEPGTVEITSERRNGELRLLVRDDGVGFGAAGGRAGAGLGIAGTRARLRGIYGDRHSFEIGDAEGGGVQAELVLPIDPSADGGA